MYTLVYTFKGYTGTIGMVYEFCYADLADLADLDFQTFEPLKLCRSVCNFMENILNIQPGHVTKLRTQFPK